MITRSRAKMASQNENPETQSQEFEINNQLGFETTEEDTIQLNVNSVNNVEDNSDRARGHNEEPQEISLSILFEFMKKSNEEQKKNNKEEKEKIAQIAEELTLVEKRLMDRLDEKVRSVQQSLQGRVDDVEKKLKEQSVKWDEKLGHKQKKIDNEIKVINKKVDKQIEENKESRERTRQEVQKTIETYQEKKNKISTGWWNR